MAEPARPRVVIAEDDADILELVVLLLTGAGFDTVAVTDGVEALAAIEADPPRLAILDIQMPRMSGIEVLRRIRESPTPNTRRASATTFRESTSLTVRSPTSWRRSATSCGPR